MLVQRRPRPEIVPSEVGWQTNDIRITFAFSRARFENCVIDTDVFASGVKLSERASEFSRAKCGCYLLQNLRGLRQMFAQSIRERAGAPQKHAAVPQIIFRCKKAS